MFNEIAFTVYAVTDMKKSRAFYEGALGLTPSTEFPATEESAWIEYSIGSGTLSIGCSPDWKPSEDGAVVALEANDFEAVVKVLKEHNVSFKLEPQDFPTCHMAVINDPDNNRVLIHKRKAR